MKHQTPRPWNLLLFAFNLLPSLGDPPPPLAVHQPAAMWATIGDAVTLNCTYPNQNGRNVQATWMRASQGPSRPLDDMNPDYVGRLAMSTLEENSRGAATLVISALTVNDSDIYFCNMEFAWTSVKGNGTRLEVTHRRHLGDTAIKLKVWQPASVESPVGGIAVLNCTFAAVADHLARTTWTRGMGQNESLDHSNQHFQGRFNMSSLEANTQGEASVTILDVRENDADIYHCYVEVTAADKRNVVAKGYGEGTRLHIVGGSIQGQTNSATMVQSLTWSIIIRSILTFLLFTGGLLSCFLSSYIEIRGEEEMEDSPH